MKELSLFELVFVLNTDLFLLFKLNILYSSLSELLLFVLLLYLFISKFILSVFTFKFNFFDLKLTFLTNVFLGEFIFVSYFKC